MTCIVGKIDKKKNKVYIGADSAGVDGLDITIRKDVKVFKVDEFIIGCTTSFRMIQILRFSFSPPQVHPDIDLYKYMCTVFIDEMRRALKAGGFMTVDSGVETGGTMLVGVRGRLFVIYDDLQVGESVDGFDSCGCGSKYALGVMKILEGGKLPERDKILKSLEVATHFSAGVRPPFVIESI